MFNCPPACCPARVAAEAVKISDANRSLTSLNQANRAEKAAISDDTYDIESVVNIFQRVAIDQNKVSAAARGDSAGLQAQSQCFGCVHVMRSPEASRSLCKRALLMTIELRAQAFR